MILTLSAVRPTARAAQTDGKEDQRMAPEEIGARVEKMGTGDVLGITPLPGGALLRAGFQKLEGQATEEGLWMTSTALPEDGEDDSGAAGQAETSKQGKEKGGRNEAAGRFRILASAVGRGDAEGGHGVSLPPEGRVTTGRDLVIFRREGLVEEYRTGVDGVRQDFVVERRPAGTGGPLAVRLAVTGAKARSASCGALLVLPGSGREIAYSRLRVSDAAGRPLDARLEVTAPDALRVTVEDAGAVYPVRIDPTFSDAQWVTVDTGLNGTVRAVAVKGSTIFVGGDFTRAGTVNASRVARWTGTKWFAMGTGMDGPVQALAVSGTDLYAGGGFTTAGGVSASRIAKWNNTAWSGLGSGLSASSGVSAEVAALAVRNSDVYAAGRFTRAGSVTVANIAKWSTGSSAWSALGAGVNGPVSALAFGQSILFAGGAFSGAGTVAASNIARWNGTSWSAMGTGVNSTVLALTASGTNLYAGGYFTSAGGISAGGVARWDDAAKAWSVFGAGAGAVSALAVSGADLYAGSGSAVLHWNGKQWLPVGSGTDGQVMSLAADESNHLMVGGSFSTAGGAASPFFAQINLPVGPEVSVYDAASPEVELNAESPAVDFGEILPGSSVIRAFNLDNYGVALLDVSGLTLPPGFEPNGIILKGTVPVRVGVQFQVRFTGGAAPGDYSGWMTVASNDPDEAELKIRITGRVGGGLTPQENWRRQYFGITAGTGEAADDADPDHDGLPNLLEWACHQNPVAAGSSPFVPAAAGTGAEPVFEYRYTRSVAAREAGVVYTVEWNTDLPGAAGSWSGAGVTETVLSTDGETQEVKATVSQSGASRLFVRLRVTPPG